MTGPVFKVYEKPAVWRNAVHLRGAALRSTGYRVFDILTVRGVVGLGRLSKNRLLIPDLNSDKRRPVPDIGLEAAITIN